MKKVDFVRVYAELSGYGFGKGIRMEFCNVEEIITQRIENGWEYCGYVPIETRGNGETGTISLVFQREE